MGNACCGERIRDDRGESLIEKYDPIAHKLSEDQSALVKKIIEFVEAPGLSKNSLEALLKDNAYKEAVNYREDTAFAPIHYACSDIKANQLKVLLENNASVFMVVGGNDWSCLQLVARACKPSVECMTLLLEYRGDAIINYQDVQQKTVLHHAVEAKNFDLVKLLLNYGADPEIEDSSLKVPFDYLPSDNAAALKEAFLSVKSEKKRGSVSVSKKTPENSTNSPPEGAIYAAEEDSSTAIAA